MDVKDAGLIAELFRMNVIDRRDKNELESMENSTRISERLLSMLSRTTSDQWELFLSALDNTGQRHLANVIRGKASEEDIPGFVFYLFCYATNADKSQQASGRWHQVGLLNAFHSLQWKPNRTSMRKN
jgi:hypothetical protein